MSKTLNCVVLGDLHLDGMSADLGVRANNLQLQEVALAEAWAVRNNISEIWYAGDVCNKVIMSYGAHVALTKLFQTNTHLTRRVILGNHDYGEDGLHSLKLLKIMADQGCFGNLIIYEKPTKEVIGGVTVNFLPYPYPDIEEDLEEGYGITLKGCINVAHFEVKGSKRDNGGNSPNKRVVEKDCLWVMGHLHTPHDVGNHVHYVGTLYQRNFGESLPKSFTHLKARNHEGDLQTKLVRVPHDPAFKLINLTVEKNSDLKLISAEPLHKYKLFVSASVRLPDNFMVNHPNVVRLENYKTARELDAFVNSKILQDQDSEIDDPYVAVGEYLVHKHPNLDDDQLKRAEIIVMEIRSRLEAPRVETLTG